MQYKYSTLEIRLFLYNGQISLSYGGHATFHCVLHTASVDPLPNAAFLFRFSTSPLILIVVTLVAHLQPGHLLPVSFLCVWAWQVGVACRDVGVEFRRVGINRTYRKDYRGKAGIPSVIRECCFNTMGVVKPKVIRFITQRRLSVEMMSNEWVMSEYGPEG